MRGKNMKKLFSIGTTVMLSASLVLAGCQSKETTSDKEKVDFTETGLPIVKNKVSLNIVAPKAPLAPDYSEMEIFKRLEESTNVAIEWTNIADTDYQEKKNLLLASGDLPDAFYGAGFTDYDLVTYGGNGTLIPLEDLIDKYAPNIKKVFERRPEMKSGVTAPDGHIYGLPIAEEMGIGDTPFFPSINKKWLDALGIPMPTTLDEYTEALRAFKTQDPNGNGKQDEIPLSFMHLWWCADIGDFFAAFGMADNLDHRIVRDGKVIFTAYQPEYKEAIKYFHQWYKEGLIDPESFTQDAAQYLAKGKTEVETLGSYIWWETEEVVGPERAGDYVLMPPLEGPNGDKLVGRSNGSEFARNAFVITSANENPEITMRWIDQQYEPKMAAQIHWGPIGIIYEEDANGMLVNLPLADGVSMGEYRQKVAPNGAGVILKEDFGTIVDMEPRAKQRIQDLENIYRPFMEKEKYPTIFFNPDELDEINTIETDIKEFVNQSRAQFITKGLSDNDWEQYVGQLEDMGIDHLMEIYQAGLDRFNEAK
jgi:putative aldouronate transport system substrate-binding protein